MRLIDLEPRWIKVDPRWSHEKNLRPVGISFKCPHCDKFRFETLFLNPVDGYASAPDDKSIPGNCNGKRYARSGLGFDDMSLAPTVSVSGHWKWELLDGEVNFVSESQS